MLNRRWIVAAAVCALGLALLAGAAVARAQDTSPQATPGAQVTDDQVNAVAQQLYCPVCQNIPLDVCGTQACADWREEIRGMLAQGMTPDQIKVRFAAKYGQRVLGAPQQQGVNWVVWILPVVGILAGAVIVIALIWRMAPGALAAEVKAQQAISYDDLDPEYVARLERELKEFSS